MKPATKTLNPYPPPPAMPPDAGLMVQIFEAQGRSFRGGAIENLGGAPMGKGHDNANQPFDLETACYLKPIFAEYDRAIANGTRLKLVLKAGVKTIKSFTLEVCTADHTCNRNGDAAIFFGTESAAETTATTRILDFFRGIPRFQNKMETLRSRFDDTMGALKFPDKTLFILAANLGNCQQKNLGFAGLQDAFVTGTTGMIEEMIARTTQYEKEAIIFLESQGGEKGFDFDRHYEDTDQRELHVICPGCGQSHIFNWKSFDEASMTRPEDFQATLPKSVASSLLKSESRQKARKELTAALLRPERRVAGFKRGPDELIKFEGGDYNEAAILRETHFECFHCGSIWRDTPDVREALDRSSHYIAARTDALPYNIGFNVPQWINRRLSWGPMMLEKLIRQKYAAEFGNYEPLKQWWQKTAGRTWENVMVMREPTISVGSYDPNQIIPDEHSRNLTVDCQKHPDQDTVGTFWVVVRVRDTFGNSRQVWRGFCRNWDEVCAVQKKFAIPNARVALDGSKWTPQIMLMAASKYEMVTGTFMGRAQEVPSCWRIFFGDDARSFRHPSGREVQMLSYAPTRSVKMQVMAADGKRLSLYLKTTRWSNLAYELILDNIRLGMPGMPKFEIMDRKFLTGPGDKEGFCDNQAKETKNFTYDKQMKARYRGEERGKEKYLDVAGAEPHYRDCELMQLVQQDMDGMLGTATAEEKAEG